jgi:hypothetical protein
MTMRLHDALLIFDCFQQDYMHEGSGDDPIQACVRTAIEGDSLDDYPRAATDEAYDVIDALLRVGIQDDEFVADCQTVMERINTEKSKVSV